MDENNELLDSPTLDEENLDSEEENEDDLDNPEEDTNEDEKSETVSKAEFNKEYSRRKRAEETIKKLKAERNKKKDKQEPPLVENSQEEDNSKELTVRQVLELKDKGYSEAEILRLDIYSQKYGVPYEKLLEDEVFKAGFEAQREKDRVARATPASTNRSITINKKTFAEMNEKERKENYSKVLDKIRKRN